MIQGDINCAVHSVTQNLINAENIAIPKFTGYLEKYCRPWWNNECQLSKKKQQNAWGIFRKYPTTSNYIANKQAKAYARKIHRKLLREF